MLTFFVPDMYCDGCIRSLTKAVRALDHDATILADLDTHRVTVTTTAPAPDVSEAFQDAGFDVQSTA